MSLWNLGAWLVLSIATWYGLDGPGPNAASGETSFPLKPTEPSLAVVTACFCVKWPGMVLTTYVLLVQGLCLGWNCTSGSPTLF